jgi:hypothetical protein
MLVGKSGYEFKRRRKRFPASPNDSDQPRRRTIMSHQKSPSPALDVAVGSAGTLASRIKTLASLRLPDVQIEGALDDLTMGNLLRWYDAGCGSGGHLAKALSLPPSRNIRAIANILTCAKESREVKGMLAALAE